MPTASGTSTGTVDVFGWQHHISDRPLVNGMASDATARLSRLAGYGKSEMRQQALGRVMAATEAGSVIR